MAVSTVRGSLAGTDLLPFFALAELVPGTDVAGDLTFDFTVASD